MFIQNNQPLLFFITAHCMTIMMTMTSTIVILIIVLIIN